MLDLHKFASGIYRSTNNFIFNENYQNKMKNYDELEKGFDQFLVESTGTLNDSERKCIQEYVDFGEYGVALLMAVGIYRDEKKIPTEREYFLLKFLGNNMGSKGDEILKNLPLPSTS